MGSEPLIKSDAANVITVGTPVSGQPDQRIFDVASINQHITDSLSALPPDKKVAFVAYADGEGVKGVIVGKITDKLPGEIDWTVLAEKPWNGAFQWGAGVRWSI
jgi:hypothetical protein